MMEGRNPQNVQGRDGHAPKGKLVDKAGNLIELGRGKVGPGTRFAQICKRVLVGTYTDGVIHAGNLAYLSLIALFPFFILLAATLSLFGESVAGEQAIDTVLSATPPAVASALEGPIREAMSARSGIFLWMGAIIALWTVGNLVETIRDILRRAYKTNAHKRFYQYRLLSIGVILGAVVLMLFSFSAQIIIAGVEQFIARFLPDEVQSFGLVMLSRIISGLGMFLAIFLLFWSLTPSQYRQMKGALKWPGALFTTIWWIAVTLALPPLLSSLLSYDATYGSMAGVMVVLFFFYLVGLGMVMGAELNAALVKVEDLGQNAKDPIEE